VKKEMEKVKNQKVEERDFSRTVICGPKEFGEIKDKSEKTKRVR
jgi:hypothetical protein